MGYATDYTTLLSGSYWSGAEVTAAPVIITYSFLSTKPTADPHGLGATLDTFTAFTAAQQTETQQALARWSGVSGVIFEQVAPGKGDINFAGYDFTGSGLGDAGGEGFFPWGNWNYSTATSTTIHFAADIQANGYGDVLMNTAAEDGNGLFAYPTLLHEIGHALGLKHPTEAWTDYALGVEHNQWDPSTYDPNYSIMSPGGLGSTLTDITANDISAIDAIYGTASQQMAQYASWSWNATTSTFTGTLKAGGQTVRGTSVNNVITGGTGNDTIYAIGQGTNTIYGKGGADNLAGGSGTNYLDGGAGADTLNGWFSVNTYASYADSTTGLTVNLLSSWLNTGDAVGDVYNHVYKIVGSNYADILTADNSGDTIRGGAGDDTITGGTGTDYLYGQAGKDKLTAGTGASYLDGGAGADTLIGSAGHASYASYSDATVGVAVNLLSPSANTGDAAGDSYTNIHDVQGSGYADTITGDNSGDNLSGAAGDDTILGGTGTDHLYGQAGKDTLIAGTGTSYLDGGAGADSLIGSAGHASYASYSDATAGVTASLLNPAANTGDAAGDSYTNIHMILGSGYADTLIADNSGDTIRGGAGDDTITGGTGTDYLYGQAGKDKLTAGTGASYLDGGAGADTLIGSAGHPSYASYSDATAGVTVALLNPSANTGDAAGDSYTNIHDVQGSGYADTITGDNSGDTIKGGAGDDAITGGTGTDYLYGQAGKDTLIAGTGTSYLDGGAGADTLIGSVGHASFASYSDATVGVTVNLLNPSANTGDAAGDSYTNIHDVLGSNYADNLTADNFGDTIKGGAGDDTITGGTGTDYLYGQAGKDTLIAGTGTSYLDGGAGADTLIGSAGHASYASYSDAAAAVVVNLLNPSANTGDAASDSYTNIHNVQGSSYSDTITGDNSGDRLNGGAGNDTIVGGTGADVITGGVGADTLTGGGGADKFAYGAASEGGDTITDFSVALGDHISVSHTGFGGGLTAGALGASHFALNAPTAATGQFVWIGASHALYWDPDGTGAQSSTLIATLTGVTSFAGTSITVT